MDLGMNFERKKDMTALGVTVGVHLLLLLFFLFFKYAKPMQQVEEPLGIEVNLGTSDNGFGDDQPEAMGSPGMAVASNPDQGGSVSPAHLNLNSNSAPTNSDAVPVATANKNKPTPVNTQKPNNRPTSATTNQTNATAQPAQQKPKLTYPGATGDGKGNDAQRNNPGGNEGIGTGNGDMGVPGGTPGASNYKGVPGQGGVTASLGNRYLVTKPDADSRFREGGTVKFGITVNRQGKIVSHRVISATNSQLRALAEQKLQSVKFNADPKAKTEAFGTIVFEFKAN